VAIHFKTEDSNALFDAICEKIEDGSIETWEIDEQGDFVHVPPQWRYSGYLRANADGEDLEINIFAYEGVDVSVEAYAVLHGRFVEMALAHCDSLFTTASVSALPEVADSVVS